MQLSRKTLQTTLSVIKVRVTPSDHPFKKIKWFWQIIRFQNFPMENSAFIVDMATKTAKECLQHWMPLIMQSGLLEQSLNSWLTQKEKHKQKKNCYKNNFLSKGKLKCRNYAGLAMSQVTNKVKNKLKRPKII